MNREKSPISQFSWVAVAASVLLLSGISPVAAQTTTAPAKSMPDVKLPSVEKLLAKMVNAFGGEKAIRKHKHQKVTGNFEMQMQGQGFIADMVSYSAAPNLTSSRFESEMTGVFLQGYNGKVAWQEDPMGGPQILDEGMGERMALQADYYAILNYKENFKSIETVGKTDFAERPCYELKLVTKSDNEQKLYVDAKTYLIAGSWLVMATPRGELEVTTYYEDYKEYEGQQIATVTRADIGGFGEQIISITDISFEPFDHSVFELPDSIKALMEDDEEPATSQPSD